MVFRLNINIVSVIVCVILYIILDYRIRNVDIFASKSRAILNKKSETIVFYNRIPKTGSTTFTNAVAYDLAEVNGFRAIHLNLTKNRFMVNLIDQGVIVRNISTWKDVLPAFYHGHSVFIDFTKFGFANPIYINLIREPFERLLSHYYFLRYGDNYRLGLKRSKAGNNETFDDCFKKEGKDCDPKQLWLQIPYFCGTASYCSNVGNAKALETAKWNLANRYMLVGLTERMEDTIKLLEHLLPEFFKGAFDHFKSLNENRAHLRYTNKKFKPSKKTIEAVKQNIIYLMEKELYDFAVSEFENNFKRSFDASDGSVLKNQFHYEKIRPLL